MKNVSNKIRHKVAKAIHSAHNLPEGKEESRADFQVLAYNSLVDIENLLRPLDKKLTLSILEFYKKHLERARFFKSVKHSKRTTPGEVTAQKTLTRHPHSPNKIHDNLDKANVTRTSNFSRKMVKYHNQKKKAA